MTVNKVKLEYEIKTDKAGRKGAVHVNEHKLRGIEHFRTIAVACHDVSRRQLQKRLFADGTVIPIIFPWRELGYDPFGEGVEQPLPAAFGVFRRNVGMAVDGHRKHLAVCSGQGDVPCAFDPMAVEFHNRWRVG